MRHTMLRSVSVLSVGILSVMLSLTVQGQCPPRGITTNPSAPSNPQWLPKTNTFDWRAVLYNLNTAYPPNLLQINGPFHQTSNIPINHFIDNKDMEPDDGWELIARNTGYEDNGSLSIVRTSLPTVVLYNKYNSLLRVFVARGDGQVFTDARIALRFLSGQTYQSSLLDLANRPDALDSGFVLNNVFAAAAEVRNGSYFWSYADFPMNYDPCTCIKAGKVGITIDFITNSTISLSGTANGTLQAIKNSSTTPSKNTFGFRDLLNGAQKASKTYKSISNFAQGQFEALDKADSSGNNVSTASDKKNALNLFQNILKSSSFLKTGLKAAPYIGAAVSLLDFFTAGGKKDQGPAEVKLTPTAIDMTIRLNGNITTSFPYPDAIFWLPGSNFNPATIDQREYPYYNEVLGVFNIINRPRILLRNSVTRSLTEESGLQVITLNQYRLADPIRFVVNPASGLQLQDAQAAIVVEGPRLTPGVCANWEVEGINTRTGRLQVRSPYADVECLNAAVFDLYSVLNTESPNCNWKPDGSNISIKFLLNFRRTSGVGQNVLLAVKYPVRISYVTNIGSSSDACNNSFFVQATPTEVTGPTGFCNQPAYTVPHRGRVGRAAQTTEEPTEPRALISGVKLSPNPAGKSLTLSMYLDAPVNARIQVADGTGRILKNVYDNYALQAGTHQLPVDLSGLSRGTYFVIIQYGNQRKVEKVVVMQ